MESVSVPADSATLVNRPTVDLNVQLTKTVLPTAHVGIKSALILVLGFVDEMRSVEPFPTDPTVSATKVMLGMLLWLVSSHLRLPRPRPHPQGPNPVHLIPADPMHAVKKEMELELVFAIQSTLGTLTWAVNPNVLSTTIVPLTRPVLASSVQILVLGLVERMPFAQFEIMSPFGKSITHCSFYYTFHVYFTSKWRYKIKKIRIRDMHLYCDSFLTLVPVRAATLETPSLRVP